MHWDLALIALQQGDADTAVQQASQAADHYERGGYEDQQLNAHLLVAEHSADETLLEQLFPTLTAGTEPWYRAGWLLVDRLRTHGRTTEATSLERASANTAAVELGPSVRSVGSGIAKPATTAGRVRVDSQAITITQTPPPPAGGLRPRLVVMAGDPVDGARNTHASSSSRCPTDPGSGLVVRGE